MARNRHTAEEIVSKLRQMDVLNSALGDRPPAPETIIPLQETPAMN